MSDYGHLIYQQRGPVTLITINRPERMNAIGPQTHRELIDAWDRFRADESALVGVLTGAGEQAFCAGGDLKAAFAGELVDAGPGRPADALIGNGHRPLPAESPAPAVDTSQPSPRKTAAKRPGKPPEPAPAPA